MLAQDAALNTSTMNDNLAISSPKWREKKIPATVRFSFSPKSRQSGEIKKLTNVNEGITKGVIEEII